MKKLFSFLGLLAMSALLLAPASDVSAKGWSRRATPYNPASYTNPAYNPAPVYKPSYDPKPAYDPSYNSYPSYDPSYNSYPTYDPKPTYNPAPAYTPPTFSCGPYMDTYVVHSLDGRPGTGIRCVKWNSTTQTNTNTSAFSWYGEGSWYSCTYRHVGQAVAQQTSRSRWDKSPIVTSKYQGFSSDIMGNGECGNASYPGNLAINVVDANTIRVTGGWNEEWNRVSSVSYAPLAAPTSCGAYFQQYRVMSMDGYSQWRNQGYTTDSSQGLRCMLNVGPQNGAWYGVGDWNGTTYSHLGTNTQNGYAASDLCKPGEFCGNMSAGSLSLKYDSSANGYYISGWNEMWLKQ